MSIMNELPPACSMFDSAQTQHFYDRYQRLNRIVEILIYCSP